jgi:hypothetical protein
MMPPAHPCTACLQSLWLLRNLQNLQKICFMVTEAKVKSPAELSNFGWCCLQRLDDLLVIKQTWLVGIALSCLQTKQGWCCVPCK